MSVVKTSTVKRVTVVFCHCSAMPTKMFKSVLNCLVDDVLECLSTLWNLPHSSQTYYSNIIVKKEQSRSVCP